MFGWKGKILRIDLSLGNCSVEDLAPYLRNDFIGGRGMGLKSFLMKLIP